MGELSPLPLARLATRALDELDQQQSIFDLPSRHFVLGTGPFDTSVAVHRHRIPAPLGPSAGPHTQMAQNIVLCWLAGARVMELKTIQTDDAIRVPRPCIDMRTVPLNVEWSQELRLEESLEEYVKASMLIEMLAASGGIDMQPRFEETMFDVSVGYDLAGIRSERVTRFLLRLIDGRDTIDRLRRQIPKAWRNIDFRTRIADTVTLSTFHGCPADEIERIADYLMNEVGVDCTIKLNPTLLGPRAIDEILHERLGYTEIRVPRSAFENDPDWSHVAEMVGRLRDRAREGGHSFGVKLTNTLVVENCSDFLPASEKHAYLSGPPLHVIAMHLVRRFRRAFGESIPISFSAGIDRFNYPDAVRLGLTPVTVCTDLLKQGGYGRLPGYASELRDRMQESEAYSIPDFIRGKRPITLAEAKILNTEAYVESLDGNPRYHASKATHPVQKRPRRLDFLDCATCDLCVPACPNDAIFRVPSLDIGHKAHQIACFAEFCNDCGNCEVFCPDDGAPNRLKFRVFLRAKIWRRDAPRAAFWITNHGVRCRFDAAEDRGDTLSEYVRRAVLDRSRINYINCGDLG